MAVVKRIEPEGGVLDPVGRDVTVTITGSKIVVGAYQADLVEICRSVPDNVIVSRCTLKGKTHYLLQLGGHLAGLVTSDAVEVSGVWAAEPGSTSSDE
jgi:hypothetical protein